MAYIGTQPVRGQYRKLSDISSGFNGSTTTFTTSVPPGTSSYYVTAGSASQLLVSLGGVIQQPDVDYTIGIYSITFTTAPAAGLSFFGVLMGDSLNSGSPADGSVTTSKLAGNLSLGLTGGSASTPSLYFTGDLNTGIYSPGADQVAISTNGTGRLFVDASGNIGINTSPSSLGSSVTTLEIKGGSTTRTGGLRLSSSDSSAKGAFYIYDGAGVLGTETSHPLSFYTGNSPRMTLDTSGRLGLGTSSPSTYGAQLAVIGGSVHTDRGIGGAAAQVQFSMGASSGANFGQIGNTGTRWSLGYGATANTIGTEVLVWNSSGQVGIGTTAPESLVHINGDATALRITRGSSIGFLYSEGTSTTSTFRVQANGGPLDLYSGSSQPITFSAATSEKARIDSSGRLLVGTSSYAGNGKLIAAGNTGGDAGTLDICWTGSRPTAANTDIGYIRWYSADNSSGNAHYASIYASSDGASSSGSDIPGRLVFSTTADGASSPTERMRITSGGIQRVTQSGSYNESTNLAGHYFQNDNNTANGFIAWNNSFASSVVQANCLRSANSAYAFYYAASGNGSTAYADTEFNLRGDGNGLCDGSWTGGGADYAEYFEWSDSNPDAEDRRGISVVLDGEKIRPAGDGEDPIGVISGNPSVVGDSAWNKWSGKYLRDDYGTYIQEDYEVVNDEGETVIQQRRKLNPAYDPDQEYTNREQRPEWDCVGLMGKLRIRKGQPTGSRWIKMRDISDSVEEWLVR